MTVSPFNGDHVRWLKSQPGHAHLIQFMGDAEIEKLSTSSYAWTLFDGETVMACVGVAEYWRGRGEVWCLFHKDARKKFVQIHGIVKRLVKHCHVKRLEAAVDTSMDSFGARWANALGFVMEARRLKAYLPTGQDCSLYARVA